MNSSRNQDDLDCCCWFVLLDNVETGPISARTIHQYYRFDRVTDNTKVRKEGSSELDRIGDCPELLTLLAKMNLERFSSIPAAKSPIVVSVPPPKVISEPSVAPPLPSVAPIAPMTPVSVSKTPPLPYRLTPPVSVPPVSTLPVSAPPVSSAVSFAASSAESFATPRPKNSPLVLVTSSGFFLVSLVILGVLLFRDTKKVEETKACEPLPVKTVEKIVEKIVYRDCVPTESAAGRTEVAVLEIKTGTEGARRKSSSKEESPDNKTGDLMAQMSVSTSSSGAPVGSFGKTAAVDSSQKAHSSSLSSEQMKRVVDNGRGSLKNCYERSLKKGEAPSTQTLRINFSVKVGLSGTVKKVQIGGDIASMSVMRDCLIQSVRKWVFPAAEQESDLEFPFVFTPTS